VSLLSLNALPIVPVRTIETPKGPERKPLVEWGKWIDRKQTPEEREEILAWIRRDRLDVAVVGGHYVEGKGFFFTIDFDLPYEEVLKKLRRDKSLITYLERTRRGRLHASFFSKRPVPSKKIKGVPIELLGRGHLVMISPSEGYVPLNDNPPKVVEDGVQLWLEFCEALGYGEEVHDFLRKESGETEVDRNVLDEWLDAIVQELKRRNLYQGRGPNYIYCLCPFHPEHNASFAINHRRYYAVDYHDGKVYKLLDLGKALGLELVIEYGDADDKARVKERVEYVVGGELIGDCLIEVVVGPKLLLYYPVENKLVLADEFRQNGVCYKPYHTIPFNLPDAPQNVGPDPMLWHDTKQFIEAYFDHLDPRVYELMVATVGWSYFYRDVKASTPYILFLGPWRSGKTRALEVLESLSYKAVKVVDPSEASLFRSIESFKPTLLIDESQIIDQNVRAVMASGYRFGSKVMRVIDPEADGFDGIKFYDTFSFIVYASREEPPSDILSRSIVVHCERNTRPTLKRIDEARALELRTRWLAQKLYHFGKIRITFEEFQSEDARLQELFSPLIVMAQSFGDDKAVESIESYGRKVERELRDYESATPEAELVEAIVRIIEEREGDAPEVVLTSEILERLNNGEWTAQRIGRRMAALGFRRFHGADGKRGYVVDLDLLERLKLRYALSQPTLTTI